MLGILNGNLSSKRFHIPLPQTFLDSFTFGLYCFTAGIALVVGFVGNSTRTMLHVSHRICLLLRLKTWMVRFLVQYTCKTFVGIILIILQLLQIGKHDLQHILRLTLYGTGAHFSILIWLIPDNFTGHRDKPWMPNG